MEAPFFKFPDDVFASLELALLALVDAAFVARADGARANGAVFERETFA